MSGFSVGTILVMPDDSTGTVGILNIATTVATREGTGIIDAEAGSALSTGSFLAHDDSVYKIYNSDLSLAATPAPFTVATSIRDISPIQTIPRALAWFASYIPNPQAGGQFVQIRRVASDGSLGPTTYTLGTIQQIRGLAPNAAETIAYYGDAAVGGAIKRWDLVNNIAMSDLVAGATTNQIGLDMAVDANGDLWVVYNANHATHVWTLLRYNAAGSLQATITLPTGSDTGSSVRMALDIGDPTLVWAQTFPTMSGSTTRLISYRIATGAVVDDITVSNGGGGGEIPFSCPFMPWSLGVPTPPTPPWPRVPPFVAGQGGLETVAQRRLRVSPHLSSEQFQLFYDQFTLDLQVGNGILTGQGVNPQIMLRMSDDGGYSWSDEILLDSGAQGQYLTRVTASGLGQARDRVFEISTSDPVSWSIIGAYLNTRKGRW